MFSYDGGEFDRLILKGNNRRNKRHTTHERVNTTTVDMDHIMLVGHSSTSTRIVTRGALALKNKKDGKDESDLIIIIIGIGKRRCI